jgi:imidazolonepropionase-like amidohydrolase
MKRRIPYTLSRYICAGVTSVVALGAIPWEHDVRELADAAGAAPRVFLAGGFIANYPPEEDSPVWEGIQTGYWIAHPDEAPELVRSLEATGIDLIKAGYIPSPDRSIEAFEPSLTALIAESHARNLLVSVHANGLADAKMVLRAGADILAHTVRDREVDEEFLRLAANGRVINTSSIGVLRGFSRLPYHRVELSDAELICGDPQVVESWEKWASIPDEERPTLPTGFRGWEVSEQTMIANIEKLNNIGIRIAVGTDGGNIGTMHGASFHNELQHLAKAGLSPMEIIVAATRNGAEALGMEDELGTLEANKLADLVILNANPLTDIANLNQITQVMVRGNLIDRDPLVLPSNR